MVEWIATKLGLPKLAIQAFSFGLLALALILVGWKVHNWREDAKKLGELQAQVETYKKQDAISRAVAEEHQKKMAAVNAENRKLNERLNNAIKNSNLGTDAACRWPAEWMPSINQSITGTP